MKEPTAAWPHPCLYEYTGHDYGGDVAKVLAETPAEAVYQKVPWYTAVVKDEWKYVRYLKPGVGEELYDLRSDPQELTNRAAAPEQSARLDELRAAMASELRRANAPAGMVR